MAVTVAVVVAALLLSACGDMARLPVSAGMGPTPELPAPRSSLLPTVNIAPAQGWPAGRVPSGPPGTEVQPFASGLEHPRWLLVLPNGDVLVAETNAPDRPDAAPGLRGWVVGLLMKRAVAAAPSENRITLLRDTVAAALPTNGSCCWKGQRKG